jgi:hypothetical protein
MPGRLQAPRHFCLSEIAFLVVFSRPSSIESPFRFGHRAAANAAFGNFNPEAIPSETETGRQAGRPFYDDAGHQKMVS